MNRNQLHIIAVLVGGIFIGFGLAWKIKPETKTISGAKLELKQEYRDTLKIITTPFVFRAQLNISVKKNSSIYDEQGLFSGWSYYTSTSTYYDTSLAARGVKSITVKTDYKAHEKFLPEFLKAEISGIGFETDTYHSSLLKTEKEETLKDHQVGIIAMMLVGDGLRLPIGVTVKTGKLPLFPISTNIGLGYDFGRLIK